MKETIYWCNQQGMYRHGAQMCTTACMQVGMAVLCGQLDLRRMRNLSPSSIQNTLNWCMNAASTVHGRIESILRHRDNVQLSSSSSSSASHPWQRGCMQLSSASRMISVNELITVLEINLPLLGVQLDELMLCQRGTETRLLHAKNGLKYKPEFCFIGLQQLPMCMVPKREGSHSTGSVTALVTANGHTVCAVCYVCGDGDCDEDNVQYALFDPMPGRMQVGLSAVQMGCGLRSMLSMPSCIAGGTVVVVAKEETDKQHQRGERIRNKMGGAGLPEDQWEQCGDGIQCAVQSKKAARKKRSFPTDEAPFYGDVTLLYMNKVH